MVFCWHIKGKISNNVIGAFKNVKKYGINGLTLASLKKDISSKIFKIIARDKNTKLTRKKFLKYFLIIYFS